MITPCPVCKAPYGFHDDESHAAVVSPRDLVRESNTVIRERQRDERRREFDAWARSLPAGRGQTAALTPTVGGDRQEEER
ncbi:MAG TPA: hypothetical protein VF506_07230 [Streptosporangiaceae bacterium]